MPEMSGKVRHPLLAALAVALLGAAPAHGIEELDYAVEAMIGNVEVRRYAPHLLATVQVEGGFEEAGNAAFRPLFDYIAGGNSTGTEISMTAPVLQTGGPGAWDVSFVMPRQFDAGTLPEPQEQRVAIQPEAGALMAALGYTGRWTRANYERHERALREALQGTDYRTCGAPLWARYNAPFVPWFMRRNEVLIPVAVPGEDC
jgi:hypothetical protein